MALNNGMGLYLLGTSVSPFLYTGTIIPFDQHSWNVVKLNKWLKMQVVIHKILSLQYNRHSFNILSYPGDLLCFILDNPCGVVLFLKQ